MSWRDDFKYSSGGAFGVLIVYLFMTSDYSWWLILLIALGGALLVELIYRLFIKEKKS